MKEGNMKEWVCRCGHEVISKEKPLTIKWSDGHVCKLTEVRESGGSYPS